MSLCRLHYDLKRIGGKTGAGQEAQNVHWVNNHDDESLPGGRRTRPTLIPTLMLSIWMPWTVRSTTLIISLLPFHHSNPATNNGATPIESSRRSCNSFFRCRLNDANRVRFAYHSDGRITPSSVGRIHVRLNGSIVSLIVSLNDFSEHKNVNQSKL